MSFPARLLLLPLLPSPFQSGCGALTAAITPVEVA